VDIGRVVEDDRPQQDPVGHDQNLPGVDHLKIFR
jgi:hypothetical protein